ncbi:reactive oxygen species modulator 1 [Daphnia magna]|uniref:reactive oxygen species modulator 1 n=1 Tax=Daphnia magna TaxID=35525 RepID=UPI0006E064BB|nr:reactive oxygen species modulator 1 [Daphnia magna]
MPMPAGGGYQQGQQQSCFDKMKVGFIMGFSIGMATGALFGGFGALRQGLRGRELINTVGKIMVQGGGTFGTFMAIGTGIRC